MKHILLTTIAAVLLVGWGKPQQSATPEAQPVEPVAEVQLVEPVAEVPVQPPSPAAEPQPVEPVAEAAQPEPPSEPAAVKRGAAGRRPDSIIYGMPHFALVPPC